ncbi:hypothetical protein BJ742DRAFT_811235 [Cladochytrium replicatum]|nr:hypothetical protein BJ742DRAFT_811235 [Cladochytrium replicatum]
MCSSTTLIDTSRISCSTEDSLQSTNSATSKHNEILQSRLGLEQQHGREKIVPPPAVAPTTSIGIHCLRQFFGQHHASVVHNKTVVTEQICRPQPAAHRSYAKESISGSKFNIVQGFSSMQISPSSPRRKYRKPVDITAHANQTASSAHTRISPLSARNRPRSYVVCSNNHPEPNTSRWSAPPTVSTYSACNVDPIDRSCSGRFPATRARKWCCNISRAFSSSARWALCDISNRHAPNCRASRGALGSSPPATPCDTCPHNSYGPVERFSWEYKLWKANEHSQLSASP